MDTLSKTDEQAAFVAGFVHGIFDDLLTSMKLLVSGKLMASGNLMRQAVEGIAVAALCASRKPISVGNGKAGRVGIIYWEHAKKNKQHAQAHKALDQLEINCFSLGVSRESVLSLRKARSRYNQFSHPGLMGIASRVDIGVPGSIYVGGHFEAAKIPAYRQEIEQRTSLCRILPSFVNSLIDELLATPH